MDHRSKIEKLLREIPVRGGLRIPHPKECLYIIPSTICNLKCRFCAYTKSSISKEVMPLDRFQSIIDRACEFGFSTFGLTPMLGEIFTDPGVFQKLEYLDCHPDVDSYSFCTNLTLLTSDTIRRLMRLNKLKWLSVSIYGHDEETFSQITDSSPSHFRSVIANLDRLVEWPDLDSRIELRLRTTLDYAPHMCDPDLRDAIQKFEERGVRIRVPHERYSNWGGIISESDLVDLNLRFKKPSPKPPIPCAFLFYKHTVLPSGRINACYAEDGNATMIIGDLALESFSEIYSTDNRRLMNLIRSHATGEWSTVCQACTGYRGVHTDHYSYQFHQQPLISFPEYLEALAESPDHGL